MNWAQQLCILPRKLLDNVMSGSCAQISRRNRRSEFPHEALVFHFTSNHFQDQKPQYYMLTEAGLAFGPLYPEFLAIIVRYIQITVFPLYGNFMDDKIHIKSRPEGKIYRANFISICLRCPPCLGVSGDGFPSHMC